MGDRLRRPRRRRPPRPGRHQLLRRVDHASSTTSAAGQFTDHTAAIGLAAPTRYLLGFGVAFLDADNDGRLDLAQANGHVNDYRPEIPYAMPAQLFLGTAAAGSPTSPTPPGPAGKSPASAAAWPSATSTTTAGSTC